MHSGLPALNWPCGKIPATGCAAPLIILKTLSLPAGLFFLIPPPGVLQLVERPVVDVAVELAILADNVTDRLVAFPGGYLALSATVPLVLAAAAALLGRGTALGTFGVFETGLNVKAVVPLCEAFRSDKTLPSR